VAAKTAEEERQFVVTLVFSKLVTWMRGQEGTPDLRALAYMDEVFGYVPPSAAPPPKKPILTIFKQGRAFGLGLVGDDAERGNPERAQRVILVLAAPHQVRVEVLAQKGAAAGRVAGRKLHDAKRGVAGATRQLDRPVHIVAESHDNDRRIVLPAGVEVEAIWGLATRQNLLVRKLTHRRDTLEEIFLKAMGHLAQTPAEGAHVNGRL